MTKKRAYYSRIFFRRLSAFYSRTEGSICKLNFSFFILFRQWTEYFRCSELIVFALCVSCQSVASLNDDVTTRDIEIAKDHITFVATALNSETNSSTKDTCTSAAFDDVMDELAFDVTQINRISWRQRRKRRQTFEIFSHLGATCKSNRAIELQFKSGKYFFYITNGHMQTKYNDQITYYPIVHV